MIKAMAALALAWSSGAWAHPGEHHDNLLATLLHLASEPDHLALMLAAVLAGGFGAVLLRRRTLARRRMFDRR
jgi:hydrogenase/urease accessory protein HupE